MSRKKNRAAAGEAARRAAARRARHRVPDLVAPSEVRYAGDGNVRHDALVRLEKAERDYQHAWAIRERGLVAAREAGASWVDLASVLGLSPQAVQQRFKRMG